MKTLEQLKKEMDEAKSAYDAHPEYHSWYDTDEVYDSLCHNYSIASIIYNEALNKEV